MRPVRSALAGRGESRRVAVRPGRRANHPSQVTTGRRCPASLVPTDTENTATGTKRRTAMTAIQDMHASISRPTEKWCADCRFGAGYPQGPRGLMRCVNPGHPTIGQFLRGPVACEGFQERDARIERPHTPAAPPPGRLRRLPARRPVHRRARLRLRPRRPRQPPPGTRPRRAGLRLVHGAPASRPHPARLAPARLRRGLKATATSRMTSPPQPHRPFVQPPESKESR